MDIAWQKIAIIILVLILIGAIAAILIRNVASIIAG
jgi:hypothetical protein